MGEKLFTRFLQYFSQALEKLEDTDEYWANLWKSKSVLFKDIEKGSASEKLLTKLYSAMVDELYRITGKKKESPHSDLNMLFSIILGTLKTLPKNMDGWKLFHSVVITISKSSAFAYDVMLAVEDYVDASYKLKAA